MIAEVAPDSPILENPNFLLQKAILNFEEEQYDASKEIFEELLDMEEWPAVVEEASLYITSIDRLTSSGGLFD